MIVKIQWPISGEPNVLLYNQTRNFQCLLPAAKCQAIKKIMNGRLKIFARMNVEDGVLVFDKEVPEQGW